MKKIPNLSIKIAFTLAMFLLVSSANAKENFEKTIVDKKIPVNKNALLHIEHQYGELVCKNWNESSISVKVVVKAEVSGYEKAEKVFNTVKVDISGDNNAVNIVTSILEKLNNNGRNSFSIDMEIYMPASLSVELDHQFGNAFIETIEGKTSINCEYGNLEIKSLKNEINEVEVSFGKGLIREMMTGEIEVAYSEFTLMKAGTASIETSYSTLSIDEVTDLEIEQEGGSCKIDKVDNAEVSSKFSDFVVENLATSMIAQTEYGNLTIKNIGKNFTKLSVENSFGAVDLNFEVGASFQIEAQTEFCTLEYPNSADFSKKITSATESYYKGVVGTNKQTTSTVTIDSDYGGVNININ